MCQDKRNNSVTVQETVSQATQQGSTRIKMENEDLE